MAVGLFQHETISTTMPKAKEVRIFAERLITLAKKGDLAARRRAIALMGGKQEMFIEEDGQYKSAGCVISKLFSELGPRYLDRPGGYTRIIKLSKRRLGDSSPLVLLQLVGSENKNKTEKKDEKAKK